MSYAEVDLLTLYGGYPATGKMLNPGLKPGFKADRSNPQRR